MLQITIFEYKYTRYVSKKDKNITGVMRSLLNRKGCFRIYVKTLTILPEIISTTVRFGKMLEFDNN
jgi:hypothetical protein